jgi:hypothetical protein
VTAEATPSKARLPWPWILAVAVAVALVVWSYARNAATPVAPAEPPRATLSREEVTTLESERRRLVSELEHAPSISPAGLASPEAIAANEKRFADLVSVLERLDGQSATPEDARPKSRELAALSRQRANVERHLYAKSRELLVFLRTSWGQWRYEEQAGLQIQFTSEEGQRRLKALADDVRMTQATLNRLDENYRMLAPVR